MFIYRKILLNFCFKKIIQKIVQFFQNWFNQAVRYRKNKIKQQYSEEEGKNTTIGDDVFNIRDQQVENRFE